MFEPQVGLVSFFFLACTVSTQSQECILADDTSLMQAALKPETAKASLQSSIQVVSTLTYNESKSSSIKSGSRKVAAENGSMSATGKAVETSKSNHTVDTLVHASIFERLHSEIIFEVSAQHEAAPPIKSKLVLVLLQAFVFPAFLGMDRCYMGQCCLGIVKALTLGGLGLWTTIDYFAVMVNSLSRSASIHNLGFVAKWNGNDDQAAFCISCIQLSVWLCACCCACGAFGTEWGRGLTRSKSLAAES